MNKFRKMKNQKGFTLVELLIVVVILGVLAAMVVPRMLAQTNAADTAEAIQMLGSIRRQAVGRIDSGTAAANLPNFNTGTGMAAGDPWGQMGMGPLPANRKFNYTLANGGTGAIATEVAATARTLTINFDTGLFTCGNGYAAITDPAGNTVGCR